MGFQNLDEYVREHYSDVLTAKDVGLLLKLHEKTVRNLTAAGQIPGVQFGKQWRYSRSAILDLLPKRKGQGPL